VISRPALLRATLPALVLFLAVASAHAECSPSDKSAAEQHYNTAYQFVTAKQWEPAVDPLEKAIAACPEHWASLELLAQARLQLKHNSTSARLYQQLIDGQYGGSLAAADGQRILRPYGFALIRSKNWEQAELVYETMLAQDPRSAEAQERLVYIYVNTDHLDKAAATLEQLYAQHTDPEKKSDVAERIGNTYQKMGQSAKATEWLQRAGSTGGSGMFQVGVDHMNSKEYAAAAQAFTNYLEENPENIPALTNLGKSYEQLGRQGGGSANKRSAIEAYEKVLALDSARHDISSSLGFLYFDIESYSKAGKIAETALDSWPDSDPKKGGMYYLMGKVLEKRDQDYEGAIGMFELALSDSYWSKFARDEIGRQEQLIEIREMRKKQGG